MTLFTRPTFFKLACVAACVLGASLPAQAGAMRENFNAPFPAWESHWFGQHSDATNYCAVWYCLVDGVPTDPSNTVRDIAGSGLVLSSEHAIGSSPITITFDPEFGATIRALTIDVAIYVESTFSAWDMNGNLIYSQALDVDWYKDIPTSNYQTLRFKAPGGVASFSLSGAADGNTVIDNIGVVTDKR